MIDWIKEIMCLLQTQITAYLEKQEHSQWRVGYETALSLSLHQAWCSIFPYPRRIRNRMLLLFPGVYSVVWVEERR